MGKAYSYNEEYWELDRDTFLDVLMDRNGVGDRKDLIGAEYFEGDSIPVGTEKLFDIESILDSINETAWDEIGELAEDYPDLTCEEKAEFKELIVSFLDKKDPRGYFRVENSRRKIITAEDLEVTE